MTQSYFAALAMAVVVATGTVAAAQDTPIQRARLSVVSIETRGRSPEGALKSESGTGFFVDRVGHILTAAHVVGASTDWAVDSNSQQLSRRVDVYGIDGNDLRVPYTTAQSAVVLYVDTQSDLALLRVVGRNFSPLRMGRSLDVSGNDSLTAVVYGNRSLPVPLPATVQLPFDPSIAGGFMRLTMAAQPGDSGGPVLNAKGEVVAIVIGGPNLRPQYSEAFATPSHLAANLIRLTAQNQDGVPIGAILPFYGSAQDIPDGYLLADGGEFRRDEFPELFALLSRANRALVVDPDRARRPDLRAQFLRGLDYGKGIDKDRALGSVQADEFKRHDHTLAGDVQYHVGGGNGGFSSVSGSSDNNIKNPKVSSEGGGETRPMNVAVNYIIRAR